ncbi:ras-specific guanine nucleotide-releasing factor 1-like isoform X2 [Vanessa atalanta]|uniref:ras-specific guanine nucleotide-releasing factor 1-like isoform X2 n=1 Tax=Vanessa atalanta TaxID=42275 RepID=UPI001FCE1BDD|nr:ras-specific guanine nucleotide-releasing factor 1-like isoform X2 [Vanessa atalanta]
MFGLKHWVSKHSSDFWSDERLRGMTMDFLKEIEASPGLLPAEHKSAAQLLRLLERAPDRAVDLKALFIPPRVPSKESVETLSALEIAEQMTYLDYQIFSSIHSEEFLGQAWTKSDKAVRAPHILMMTAHFNHISNLVISEILKKYTLTEAKCVVGWPTAWQFALTERRGQRGVGRHSSRSTSVGCTRISPTERLPRLL